LEPIGDHILGRGVDGLNSSFALICFTAVVCVLAARPVRAEGAASASVRVSVKGSSCDPDELTVQAGGVTFLIHNATSQAVEWEILDGVMVVEERENIAPGATQPLTANLTAGDYQITCGLISNPRGTLHVSARDGASVKVAQTDFIGPLAEYRFYAGNEIDGLVDDMHGLADALKAGNLASARQLYGAVHAHYARIAPVALYFPDLDGMAGPEADSQNPPDPTSVGFRQLEWELSSSGSHNFIPLADKLVADVAALRSRFEALPLTPRPTFAGAVQTIGGSATAEIGQASTGLSSAELADLQGYIEGARKIVSLFQPLIQKTDKHLSTVLTEDFATLTSTLAKYQTPDNAFEHNVNISSDDRSLLQTVAKRLTTELGLIPSALGMS
jgi:iron uptake system component EfeO